MWVALVALVRRWRESNFGVGSHNFGVGQKYDVVGVGGVGL